MRILILGGDGYLGWPTAMHFSARGHEVAVADNFMRRRLCWELDVQPLIDVPSMTERVRIWRERTGQSIEQFVGDLSEWEFMDHVMGSFGADAVVHYAEQPSAPYSMIDRKTAYLTLHNNLTTTFNLIHAARQSERDVHIVKLGTMGEYGTPNIDIEEGWINISHKGREDRFLFPRQSGSLYHTTKIMDTDLLWFYVRVWDLKVTDLMQGPVYGIHVEEAGDDDRLYPFFNYDEVFGTVLNRFVVQAVCGQPLSVYGAGGQTRGFLNIEDTLQCIRLAVEQPPKSGELRVLNQFTEVFSVQELALKVQSIAAKKGYSAQIRNVSNPRRESEDHYYNPAHTGFGELGLEPHLLTDEVLEQMLDKVVQYRERIRTDTIMQNVCWD